MFLVKTDNADINSYRQVAHELGMTAGGVKTLVFRLRKRFTAVLREEVAQTLVNPAEIDSELSALCDALIISGGRG
jgi:RNA polymerase sigma-70 factor (ECF subfamily)